MVVGAMVDVVVVGVVDGLIVVVGALVVVGEVGKQVLWIQLE